MELDIADPKEGSSADFRKTRDVIRPRVENFIENLEDELNNH